MFYFPAMYLLLAHALELRFSRSNMIRMSEYCGSPIARTRFHVLESSDSYHEPRLTNAGRDQSNQSTPKKIPPNQLFNNGD